MKQTKIERDGQITVTHYDSGETCQITHASEAAASEYAGEAGSPAVAKPPKKVEAQSKAAVKKPAKKPTKKSTKK
jgi:hypothetical protein